MIDLHNHILPGVDDGAAALEESLQIAHQFVSEGVTAIAATPHLDPERSNGIRAPEVRRGVAELRETLDQAGIGLEVVPGNELYLTPDAPSLLAEGHVAPLGDGRSVLVELSLVTDRPPLFLDDVLFRLQVDGYLPVLAHPERYPFVQRDVSVVERWVEQGVTLQVTAPSLLGEYGTVIRRTAEAALRRNAYALAASDRHHPGAGRSLSKLHARITDLTDASVANLLLTDNPRRVLSGQPTITPQHRPPDPAGLLGRLLNR